MRICSLRWGKPDLRGQYLTFKSIAAPDQPHNTFTLSLSDLMLCVARTGGALMASNGRSPPAYPTSWTANHPAGCGIHEGRSRALSVPMRTSMWVSLLMPCVTFYYLAFKEVRSETYHFRLLVPAEN